jgi:hypothetical protein
MRAPVTLAASLVPFVLHACGVHGRTGSDVETPATSAVFAVSTRRGPWRSRTPWRLRVTALLALAWGHLPFACGE